MIALPPYIVYLLAFICALSVSLISIPKIIYIAKRKRLFDVPDNNRKVHLNIIPNLGGVGIFFAYIIVTCLFINPIVLDKWNYIIASTILLFLTGINDDLITLSPSKKFLAQFVAAIITVCFADIRVNSLHGFLGIEQLPYWYSVCFSVLGCMFITNAFNLIDGIDGLAGSIGVMCTFSLGMCLAFVNNVGAACMSFALMGAIIGFLRYNVSPAKIFMGDTGSLLIGFTISILSILFVHSYNTDTPLAEVIHSHKGSLIVTLAILSVPVFDSFRVFSTRIAKGGSPFKADRTHLHHYLLDLGYTHSGSVSILIISNILVITVALLVQDYDPNIALASIVVLAMGLFMILYTMRKKRLERNRAILAARNKQQIAISGNTSINTNAVGTAIISNDKK